MARADKYRVQRQLGIFEKILCDILDGIEGLFNGSLRLNDYCVIHELTTKSDLETAINGYLTDSAIILVSYNIVYNTVKDNFLLTVILRTAPTP